MKTVFSVIIVFASAFVLLISGQKQIETTETTKKVKEIDCKESVVLIAVGVGPKKTINAWHHLSGFIFEDKDGKWVISAGHLVKKDKTEEIKKIIAYFHSKTKNPENLKLVGYDSRLDISLLKFVNQKAVKDLPALKLGSSNNLKTGQGVISIGHLSILKWTETSGEIVNLVTGINYKFKQPQLIIHSSVINPGSSGSPLLNSQKEVVGVNVMLIYPLIKHNYFKYPKLVNILSAAVPIDDIKSVLPRLKKGGKVERQPVGMNFEYSSRFHKIDLRKWGIKKRPPIPGLMVYKLRPDSVEEKADFQLGDIILSCDDKVTENIGGLYRTIYFEHGFDELMKIKINRYGKEMIIDLNFPAP